MSFNFLRLARRLIVGVVLAYTAVVLILGGTAAARPVFYAFATGWILLLAMVTYLFRRRTNSAPPPLSLRLPELVCTNFALTLLLAEGSLRAFAAWSGNPFLTSAPEDGYRLAAGQDYGAGLRGNRMGYPGGDFQHDKRPGVSRIAALGDSFAIGPAVPFADNYLTVLEKSLPKVEVYNFGVAGIGPREYLSILRRDVWPYHPDLVLLSIFVGNDITETLATPRHLDPRQHALYLLCQRGWRIAWASGSPEMTVPNASNRCTSPPLSPQAYREVEARRLAICFHSPPRGLEKKWERTFAYLAGVVQECKGHDVPLAVVLIPDEFQVNPAVLTDALAEARIATSVVDLELPQRRLSAFFGDRGVPCLDLLPAFGHARDLYAPFDTHWNVRGNRLAADQLRKWLCGQGWRAGMATSGVP